ncbi:MAG: proline--tRNA ligase [Patescibacteria group bacterium]|jgi:prolyl-tRNA synthetase
MSKEEITKREEDYSEWYLDVIKVADLADYAPVKGCMVIKPNGYAMWEKIQQTLDKKFKETGVANAYFPLLIPESYLKREAEHVEGFAPELAVVTHAGGKKLDEPLVIRPTSETIIYEMFSRWISSYRDLPLLINQWANVVRWEMRTRLFLRTTEFLWQEGHTAHSSEEDADKRARMMLDIYQHFCEEYLAIPVIAGQKTEAEKFAGAERTYTIEAMMQDGKALQSGTSHMLGQSFAKAFNVKYLSEEGKEEYVWLTSWGVSTRLIGGVIMAHSDDKGLVLPPKIASTQVVIIPIWTNDEEKAGVMAHVSTLLAELEKLGITAKIDDRDMRPGPKFFEWEKKGIPVRVEIGPKDIASGSAVLVRRDSGEKDAVSLNGAAKQIEAVLSSIQHDLFQRALDYRTAKTKDVSTYDELANQVEAGFARAHWCGNPKCEAKVKEETKATIRCIPFDQQKEGGQCVVCGQESSTKVIFARSY